MIVKIHVETTGSIKLFQDTGRFQIETSPLI